MGVGWIMPMEVTRTQDVAAFIVNVVVAANECLGMSFRDAAAVTVGRSSSGRGEKRQEGAADADDHFL